MKNLKTLGIAGGLVAAALVGGTLISMVAAAPSSSRTNSGLANVVDKARYCALWQKTFADEFGVSVDALVPAAKAATIATIDAAVTAGDLTAERAKTMKAKIETADANACRLLGHPFHGVGGGGAKAQLGADLLDAAAGALGLEPAALIEALRGGDSLKQIATDQSKDYANVSKAIHDAAKADLDAAVAAGNLVQARADEMLSRLDAALASGEFPRHGGHGPGHFGIPGPAQDKSPGESPAS